MSNKFIIFLGLPGSGKGTQSKVLLENCSNCFSLSTGEAIRNILKNTNDDFSKKIAKIVESGNLIDDLSVTEIVSKYLDKFSLSSDKDAKIILDGFPRTIQQAISLDSLLSEKKIGEVNLIIIFDLKKRLAIKRLTSRVICKSCGSIYSNLKNKNQKCDKCSGELVKRNDDNIKSIRQRIANEKKMIDFLIKFYHNKKIKCFRMNAGMKINALHKKIKSIFECYL